MPGPVPVWAVARVTVTRDPGPAAAAAEPAAVPIRNLGWALYNTPGPRCHVVSYHRVMISHLGYITLGGVVYQYYVTDVQPDSKVNPECQPKQKVKWSGFLSALECLYKER